MARGSGSLYPVAIVALLGCSSLQAQSPKEMTFFVTSVGSGKGGDLGGLEGADRLCTELARAAGAGERTWRAYLSTSGAGGVDARDRIGKGPWKNAKGVVIATSVENLHGENAINADTALTERGEKVNSSFGDWPTNMHDILTGSRPSGRAFTPDRGDRTCRNWTSSGEGAAWVGHHDRRGLGDDADSKSWNSAHRSRGCSVAALRATGGDGRFYCFAAD